MHRFYLVRESGEGCPEEVMLALRAEGMNKVSVVESRLGRGNSMCRGPVTGDSIACMSFWSGPVRLEQAGGARSVVRREGWELRVTLQATGSHGGG